MTHSKLYCLYSLIILVIQVRVGHSVHVMLFDSKFLKNLKLNFLDTPKQGICFSSLTY